MLSTFIDAAPSGGRNDQGVGRGADHRPEIGGRSAAYTADGVGGAALVDAEPAIHPVEAEAALGGLGDQRRHPFPRQRMVLLLDVAAVDGVRMRLLAGKRQADGALI